MPRSSAPRTDRSSATVLEIEGPDAKADRQGVQVVVRVGEILRLLKVSAGGLTQAEMATHLGLARTTVHRLLNALAKEGLVELGGSGGRYRLGVEILQMADAARTAVISEAHSILQRLSDEIKETVDLSVLDRGRATFVDQVVSAHRLRAVSAVGAHFPLYCTANGKAMLAELSLSEARRILPDELAAQTPNTITSRDALLKELEAVREAGFATDMEEHSLGICAVGISLGITPLGCVALSVPMPTQRFESKRNAAVKALLGAADEIRAVFSR